jgi:hypothetical protein
MSIKNAKEINLIFEEDKELRKIFTYWANVKEKSKNFTNKCTEKTFEKLFNNDSKRLWNNYTVKCNRNFDKFLTYLTNDQKTILIYNMCKSEVYMYY